MKNSREEEKQLYCSVRQYWEECRHQQDVLAGTRANGRGGHKVADDIDRVFNSGGSEGSHPENKAAYFWTLSKSVRMVYHGVRKVYRVFHGVSKVYHGVTTLLQFQTCLSSSLISGYKPRPQPPKYRAIQISFVRLGSQGNSGDWQKL